MFRDGKGTFSYKNGDLYTGQFDNDEFNGKGKISFGSLDAYEGDFIDGRLEGLGVMEYKVGMIRMYRMWGSRFIFRRTEQFTRERGWIGDGMATEQLHIETVCEPDQNEFIPTSQIEV